MDKVLLNEIELPQDDSISVAAGEADETKLLLRIKGRRALRDPGLPPEKGSSLMYGFRAEWRTKENEQEETHGRGDRR